jgi:hypothetical protein
MKNKIIVILTLLAGIFTLNSCLKDEADYWKDQVAGKMYATIAAPGLQTKSLLLVPDDIEVTFLVNIATDVAPSSDVTLTLAFDNDAISAYDSTLKAAAIANGDTTDAGELIWKDYKPYPSVVLNTPTITIPAGSKNAYAKMTVNRADTLQLSGNYMAAVTITSVTGNIPIAANMKTVLYAFPIANEWEGFYLSEGFRDHPTLGIEPFKYAKMEFLTTNANTVHKTQVGNYSGYGLDITILTDQIIVVGGVDCYKLKLQITGMASDSDMGVYETYNGDPMNYYNPVTKVFELYYYYNNAAPRKLRETDSRI